ncbi:MAG: RidA family protein [Trueperaceae bacterium]|nr:RidA family protein [Trueperaceae bacterium]
MPTKTVYANPNATLPLSPLTRIGDTLYTAGQVGVDPATRATPDGVRAQTRQVLLNLRSVLALAGADLSHVVKTTVFLTDMADFAEFNEEYRAFFPVDPPARSTVGVAALARPDLVVEIEAIAVVAEG